MRRSSRVVLVVAVLAVAGMVSVSPALAKTGPDLAVSSLAEPPDGVPHAGAWQESYTVANQGNRRAGRTSVRFYLARRQHNPRKGDFRLRGNASKARIRKLGAGNELARRIKLRVPASVPNGNYYLVACIDKTHRVRETDEGNNCRITGQVVALGAAVTGPDVSGGNNNTFVVARTTLPIGSATVQGPLPSPGDDEKSNQRKQLFKVGPITVIADCKRTTNGDRASPGTPFSNPTDFDEDGDEGKILVYTSSGTETFSSLGASSRRNIPPGEGSPAPGNDTNGPPAVAQEHTGGEGKHMALAVARDPQQASPEQDWVTAFKASSIYVATSGGTEFAFHAYAGIDVLGVGDRCVFGGVVTLIHK
jgi:hypothetical protein